MATGDPSVARLRCGIGYDWNTGDPPMVRRRECPILPIATGGIPSFSVRVMFLQKFPCEILYSSDYFGLQDSCKKWLYLQETCKICWFCKNPARFLQDLFFLLTRDFICFLNFQCIRFEFWSPRSTKKENACSRNEEKLWQPWLRLTILLWNPC